MLYWIPYAFVRISVFFVAGILLGIYFPYIVPIGSVITFFLFGVTLYFAIWFFNRWKKKTVLNPGLIGLLAVFSAGYANVFFRTDLNRDDHISKSSSSIIFYEGVISRYGQEKEKSWKEVIELRRAFDSTEWKTVSGNVLIYLPKTDFPNGFRYGDKLLIKGRPQVVAGPANPGEFDHQKFLAAKNIFHQHFLSARNVMLVENDPPSRIMAISIDLRLWADRQLKAVVHGAREQAIASALVLGISDGLDNELMGAYAATGALHVLSVSGLHVGILYMLIMFLLKPVQSVPKGKWIIAGVSLAMLWIYACVTGLSPSVLRAVTMFSFMVIARPLDHRTNIYNVLTTSAFVLLLFDPYLILSVGFQLSYLAVFGIVYLQPLLYNLLEPESRLLDEIWKVTAVSIAAQVATFAVGLLYFHQFPNYFLVSNLYVLPLGFTILVGGLAVLALSFVTPVAVFLGLLLEWMIRLLNYLTFLTESLPFSVISDIHINTFQCFMIMAFTVAVLVFIQHRKVVFLYIGAFALVSFAGASWMIYEDFSTARMSVYRVPGHTGVDLFDRGKAYCIIDTALSSDKIRYHIQVNRTSHFVGSVQDAGAQTFTKTFDHGTITCFNGKTIIRLLSAPEQTARPVHVDYLIVSQNAINSLRQLEGRINAGVIIIDSSNSFQIANRLVREQHPSSVHSVWHEGAFDKNI